MVFNPKFDLDPSSQRAPQAPNRNYGFLRHYRSFQPTADPQCIDSLFNFLSAKKNDLQTTRKIVTLLQVSRAYYIKLNLSPDEGPTSIETRDIFKLDDPNEVLLYPYLINYLSQWFQEYSTDMLQNNPDFTVNRSSPYQKYSEPELLTRMLQVIAYNNTALIYNQTKFNDPSTSIDAKMSPDQCQIYTYLINRLGFEATVQGNLRRYAYNKNTKFDLMIQTNSLQGTLELVLSTNEDSIEKTNLGKFMSYIKNEFEYLNDLDYGQLANDLWLVRIFDFLTNRINPVDYLFFIKNCI